MHAIVVHCSDVCIEAHLLREGQGRRASHLKDTNRNEQESNRVEDHIVVC